MTVGARDQHSPAPAGFLVSRGADGGRGRRRIYWVALRSANDAYDRSLLDPAFDIADNVRIDAGGAHVDLPREGARGACLRPGRQGDLPGALPTNAIVDGVARSAAAAGLRARAAHVLRWGLRWAEDPGRRASDGDGSCRSGKRCTSAIDLSVKFWSPNSCRRYSLRSPRPRSRGWASPRVCGRSSAAPRVAAPSAERPAPLCGDCRGAGRDRARRRCFQLAC